MAEKHLSPRLVLKTNGANAAGWLRETEHSAERAMKRVGGQFSQSSTSPPKPLPNNGRGLVTNYDPAKAQHSAIAYFVSSSPRQPSKVPVEKLKATAASSNRKKLNQELSTFEKAQSIPNNDDDNDDDDGHSPLGRPRNRNAPSPSSSPTASSKALVGMFPPLQSEMSIQISAERSSTPPPQAPQEFITGKRVPVVSTNPITGVLCNVPLHLVFNAYRDQFIRGVRARRASQSVMGGSSQSAAPPPSKKEPLRLTLEDFIEMLHVLVPDADVISRDYARRMIEPFGTPGPYGGPPKIVFTNVFSYLVKCFGHPSIEKNIRFIFKCLDPKGKGFIPYTVMTGRVIRSWAENRVVGGAIFQWRELARALEAAGDVDVRLLENPSQITKDELRMLSYTTSDLTEAMQQDLECELTEVPRFPTLPGTGKLQDDASSGYSQGNGSGSGRHRLL